MFREWRCAAPDTRCDARRAAERHIVTDALGVASSDQFRRAPPGHREHFAGHEGVICSDTGGRHQRADAGRALHLFDRC
jgi:hypothetical protein